MTGVNAVDQTQRTAARAVGFAYVVGFWLLIKGLPRAPGAQMQTARA